MLPQAVLIQDSTAASCQQGHCTTCCWHDRHRALQGILLVLTRWMCDGCVKHDCRANRCSTVCSTPEQCSTSESAVHMCLRFVHALRSCILCVFVRAFCACVRALRCAVLCCAVLCCTFLPRLLGQQSSSGAGLPSSALKSLKQFCSLNRLQRMTM